LTAIHRTFPIQPLRPTATAWSKIFQNLARFFAPIAIYLLGATRTRLTGFEVSVFQPRCANITLDVSDYLKMLVARTSRQSTTSGDPLTLPQHKIW
jgi:hypothetical protein